MDITFYRNLAEQNRVDKTAYLTPVFSQIGNLRSGSSISSPVIEFDITGVQQEFISSFNYIYIQAFSRYYFVIDKTIEYNNLLVLSCQVDVLMSFKIDFLKLPAFVIRNENVQSNTKLLKDNLIPINSVPDITSTNIPSTTKESTFFSQMNTDDGSEECFYVINCNSGDTFVDTDATNDDQTTENSTVTTYILNRESMRTFYNVFLLTNSEAMSYVISIYMITSAHLTAIFKKIYNDKDAGEYITGCEYVTVARLGVLNVDVNGIVIRNNTIFDDEALFDLSITKTIQDYEPFRKFSLLVPMYGEYPLDISKFIPPNYGIIDRLYLRERFDFQVGSATILICGSSSAGSRGPYYETFSFQIFPQIPKNYDNSDEVSRRSTANGLNFIGSVLSSWGNSGGEAWAEGVVGLGGLSSVATAASRAFGSTGHALTTYLAQQTLNVPYGKNEKVNSIIDNGMLPTYFSPGSNCAKLITYDFRKVDDIFSSEFGTGFAKLCGFRCFEIKPLSEFTGFTVVADIHLENIGTEETNYVTMTTTEVDMLDKELKTGVII